MLQQVFIIIEAVLAVIGWAGVLVLRAQYRKVKAEAEALLRQVRVCSPKGEEMSTSFDKWCEDIIDAAIAHASVSEKEIVVEVPGALLERLTQKLQEAKEELGFTGSVRFIAQKLPSEEKR